MRLVEKIAGYIFPKGLYCNCCGKYIDDTRTYSLCDYCIRNMTFEMTDLKDLDNEELFHSAAAAMGYGLYERQLIFGLKYSGRTYMARDIADILYDCLMADMAEKKQSPWLIDDLIVPVPIHRQKLKTRGFNQAEKIARHLGKRIGIPVCGDALWRTRQTEAQRALSARDRENNMSGVFKVNPKDLKLLEGRNILLLDDIYTTGATAKSCARVLLGAGAARVDFLALSSAKNKQHEFFACKESDK